jgi:hypothetical protein
MARRGYAYFDMGFRVLGFSVLLFSCRPGGPAVTQAEPSPKVTLLASVDLPHEARTHELSGIAWDARTRTLYAIQDEAPKIIPLSPGEGYTSWSVGEPIAVRIPAPWDGEGIVVTDSGFIIANEAGPHLYELDRTGAMRAEIPLPAHYATARDNLALESLSLTPDGRFLFTVNESALAADRPEPSTREGTTVRILRIERATGAQVEIAYRTDPIFAAGEGGMIGVADVAAISEKDLLVLERSYVPSVGNEIRVYRASLEGAADVLHVPALSAETPVAKKTLLFDLASIPRQALEFPGKPPRAHPLYPNFEGLAFGPRLADGRRLLFVVADDNALAEQVPRVLTLAVEGLF